jgi:hypothetical protein
MEKYNANNIDKALKRMEKMDALKDIPLTTSNIMSFFDNNDQEYDLQQQKSISELKKEEYLQSINLLKNIVKEKGAKDELKRIQSFNILLEVTDFLTMTEDRRSTIKINMEWCNKIYEKYLDI